MKNGFPKNFLGTQYIVRALSAFIVILRKYIKGEKGQMSQNNVFEQTKPAFTPDYYVGDGYEQGETEREGREDLEGPPPEDDPLSLIT